MKKDKSFLKRVFYILIGVLGCAIQVDAQNSLDVHTVVPTSATNSLQVGVGTAPFSTEITNANQYPAAVSNISFQLPNGVSIESGSLVITDSNGGQVAYNAISGSSISLQYAIPVGKSISVSYRAKADCKAVPDASSSFSVSQYTCTNVQYSYNGSSEQTARDTSNSYPILYPNLHVETPSSPRNSKEVEWQQTFSDTIPITNASGAGKASTMRFCVSWAENNAIELTALSIKGISGIEVIPLSDANVTTKSAYVDIMSEMLTKIGFSNGTFDASASLSIIPTYKVHSYFSSLQTTYTIDYLVDDDICVRNSNAIGIMYYTQEYPSSQLTAKKENVIFSNWCERNYETDIVISNIGEDKPGNTMLNCYLYIDYLKYCSVVSVTMDSIPLTEQNGKWYLMAENIDGDDVNSDIKIGASYRVHIVIEPDNTSDYSRINQRFMIGVKATQINGTLREYHVSAGDNLSNVTSSVLSPTDVLAGQSATYTYTYSAQHSNFNVSNSDNFYEPGYAEVQQEDGLTRESVSLPSNDVSLPGNDVLSGFNTLNISPVLCDMSQKFLLKLYTNGCSTSSTITSAGGNAVITCQDTAYGCYEMIVEGVNTDNPVVNTCDEIVLKANGHLDYWCSDTCPRPSQFVVSVYNSSIPLNVGFSNPTILIDGKSYGLEEIVDTGINRNKYGVSWTMLSMIPQEVCDSPMVKSLDIEFKGSVMVGSDHSLPEMTNMNLRVDFAFIDADGRINTGGKGHGVAVTVYDPEPTFNSMITTAPCNYIETVVSVTKSNAPYTRPINITKITYPAVPRFFYDDIPYCDTIDVSDEVNVSVRSGEEKKIKKNIYPWCVQDGISTPTVYSQITYTDYYESCTDDMEYEKENINLGKRMYMPTIKMHPTDVQQSIESTTTWTLQVENSGSAWAEHVMLKIEVDDEHNPIDMYISAINGETIPLCKTRYVDLSTMSWNTQKEITITAYYRKCIDKGTSAIKVSGVWNCFGLTEDNFDYYECTGDTTTLLLENMTAVLSAVETYPNDSIYYSFCEDIPISIDIENTGRADLTKLGFWFTSLGDNVSLVNSRVDGLYKNSPYSIYNSSNVFFAENSIISQSVLSNENSDEKSPLHGTDPAITLDFNVQYHCSADETNDTPIGVIKFQTSAKTNCGDEQIKEFRYKPRITGFEYLDSIQVHASGGTFSGNMGTTSMSASVTNTSSTMVDSAYITVVLPKGVIYNSYEAVEGTTIHSVDEYSEDGRQVIEFELTKGTHLQPHETVSVNINIQDTAQCPEETEVQVMGTLKRLMQDCESKTCIAVASTDAVIDSLIRISPVFSAELAGPDSCCLGDSEIYNVTGIGIASIAWTTKDAIVTKNGNAASVVFNKSDNHLVTTEICGVCKCITDSVETYVDSIPVVVIPEQAEMSMEEWGSTGISNIIEGNDEGEWKQLSGPQDGKCGTYQYSYSLSSQCGSDVDTITVSVTEVASVIELDDIVTISWSDWKQNGLQNIQVSPENGVWSEVSSPSDNLCGTYTYRYTVKTECHSVSDDIILSIENVKPIISLPNSQITAEDWESDSLSGISVSQKDGAWELQSSPNGSPCGDYTYVYSITTECGTESASVSFSIIEDEPVISLADTMTIEWDDWEKDSILNISVTPLNGTWNMKSAPEDTLCGEYKYSYTVASRCYTKVDTIAINIIHCCGNPNPWGNLANPNPKEGTMEGVTTLDVSVLMYYIDVLKADKSKLVDKGDYELYQIKLPACDGDSLPIDLVPCFPRWADVNKDGAIDDKDVEDLKSLVK